MSFQTPITIKKALGHISSNDYVLPAIQREVVWRPDQIVRLFDSLMQGYPIGSFLFWKVDKDHVQEYVFYEFMTDYHQLYNRHLKRFKPFSQTSLTGVLDGQQRLTALNIGLRGSYAEKLPRLWVTNPAAFPKKHLYLGLDDEANDNDLGMRYDFRFLTDEAQRALENAGEHWFRVSRILELPSLNEVFTHLLPLGLTGQDSPFAFPALSRLHTLIHQDPVVNYFEEAAQDLDKVLNIFIRVNSGGTVLSYSDLLLSIATAQWKKVDAREEIHALVDKLNDTGKRFSVNKDLVLKSGLMLSDIPSVAFRVTNFNTENMSVLESNWPKIAISLGLTMSLMAEFGLSDRTLTADSTIIPVAYYLYKRDATQSYVTSSDQEVKADRQRIRGWVIRSLLKPGIWGSGLDPLLLSMRSIIASHDRDRFPVEEIEAMMAQRGKSLQFSDQELNDLVDTPISDRRAFALLSLLYPGMNFHNDIHLDHVFPRSLFTTARLAKAGVPNEQIPRFQDAVDRLANLQLLEGAVNESKNAKLPAKWIASHLPEQSARETYRQFHRLGDIPEEINGFGTFYLERRSRILLALQEMMAE